MFKKFLAAFLMLGVLGSLGCQDEFIDEGEVRFRAVVLSPNSPNLDVSYSDEPILVNAPYTTSTGYVRVLGGNRSVKVRQTGTTPILAQTSQDFLTGGRYTYAVVGLAGSLENVIFADPIGTPATGDSAIRVFHAAPSLGGNVDWYVTAPGAPLAGETPIATNVAFKSVTNFVIRTSGNYQVRATTTGTTTEVFTSPTVALNSTVKQTAILVDAAGGGAPLGMLFLQD